MQLSVFGAGRITTCKEQAGNLPLCSPQLLGPVHHCRTCPAWQPCSEPWWDLEVLSCCPGLGDECPVTACRCLGFCVLSAVNPAGNSMNYCLGEVQEEPQAQVHQISENVFWSSSVRLNLSLFPKENLLKQTHTHKKRSLKNYLNVLISWWRCAAAITIHIMLLLWKADDYLIAV